MKVLSIYLTLMSILLACQTQKEDNERKINQKQVEIKKDNKKKGSLKFDCKNAMQWLRENAVSVNPDTFSRNYSVFDSSYKRIDTLLYSCFDFHDMKKVKNYWRDYKGKEHYESRPQIHQAQLLDIYTNKKNQIKAFTVFALAEIGTNLTYIRVKPNTTQVLDAVILANNGGDIGTLISENSIWVNDSTLIKTLQHSRVTLDNVFYQAKVQINLHKNGKISISNPQTLINIPFEEVLKKESVSYTNK